MNPPLNADDLANALTNGALRLARPVRGRRPADDLDVHPGHALRPAGRDPVPPVADPPVRWRRLVAVLRPDPRCACSSSPWAWACSSSCRTCTSSGMGCRSRRRSPSSILFWALCIKIIRDPDEDFAAFRLLSILLVDRLRPVHRPADLRAGGGRPGVPRRPAEQAHQQSRTSQSPGRSSGAASRCSRSRAGADVRPGDRPAPRSAIPKPTDVAGARGRPRCPEAPPDAGRQSAAAQLLGTEGHDEDVALLVADHLGVVRDRAVPAEVVARADFDDMVALGHPPAPAQDQVMLVAGVGVQPGPAADRRDALDDRRGRGCRRRRPVRCGRGRRASSTGRSAARTTRRWRHARR